MNNINFPKYRKALRNKQRIKVAKMHEKVANQRKDFLHKQSRQIANAYDCVCIEDLDMKAMAQCLNFGKSVVDNGWGMFVPFLQYKLDEQGKQLIKVVQALKPVMFVVTKILKRKILVSGSGIVLSAVGTITEM